MPRLGSERRRWSKTTVAAVIAAIGSSLTAATVIIPHDSPIWAVSTILLAGVTTLGVGLGVHVTEGKQSNYK